MYKLSVLRRLSSFLPKPLLEHIYLSCIEPNLDYADPVWGICGASGSHAVQRLQNYAARIICRNFDFINTRGIELVYQLGWPTIEERRKLHTAVLMFKCIHGLAPDYLCDQVNLLSQIATRNTRSAHTLDVMVPEVKKEIFKKSFEYQGAVLWNSLPQYVRQSDDVGTFKKRLKQHCF